MGSLYQALFIIGIALGGSLLLQIGRMISAFIGSVESKNQLRESLVELNESRAEINEAIAEKISDLDMDDRDFVLKLEKIASIHQIQAMDEKSDL